MQRIKDDMAAALSKSKCQLHAYVIMPNHLHLLITPAEIGMSGILILADKERERFGRGGINPV